jgi:hypothetical protein
MVLTLGRRRMQPDPHTSRGSKIARRSAVAVLVAALLAFAGVRAYYELFWSFSWWDDEGCLMLSVADFQRGEALYDGFFSQYGPFYFLTTWLALHVPGVELGHASVRVAVAVVWVASAALLGGFVYRSTRAIWPAVVLFLGAVGHLSALATEPAHPSGLVVLLLSLALFASTFFRRPRRMLAGLGAIAAALLLTKVNLGVFLLVSAGAALLTSTELSGALRFARPLAWLAAIALPIVLMHSQLAIRAGRDYCIAVVTSVLALALSLLPDPPRPVFRLRELAAFALAFALAACAISGFALARGTSASGLLHGVVLQHLDFVRIFLATFRTPATAPWWSASSLALVLLHLALRRGTARAQELDRSLIVFGKLAFGVAVLWWSTDQRFDALIAFAAPFVWLCAARSQIGAASDDAAPERAIRILLAAIAALQTLHAFPSAGSQQAWSSLLLLPAAVLCLVDAADVARDAWRLRERGRALATAVRVAAVSAILAPLTWHCWSQIRLMRAQYELAQPLALRGTGAIRIDERDVATYQWLVHNLAPFETFYSLPGLNSLYFWTGKRSPTRFNLSGFWFLLTQAQQETVIAALDRQSSLAVVHVARDDYFPALQTDGTPWPLLEHIRQRYETAARVGMYELRLRPGTAFEPTYCAAFEPEGISLRLPALGSTPIRSISICDAARNDVKRVGFVVEERSTTSPTGWTRIQREIDVSRPRELHLRCDAAALALVRDSEFPLLRLGSVRSDRIAVVPFVR